MSETHFWDGLVASRTQSESSWRRKHAIADASKNGDWRELFELLDASPSDVNGIRPDGSAMYSPLHQVAWHGASVNVARRLIELGAWRTLPDARGECAFDIAHGRQHTHLSDILMPSFSRNVPTDVVRRIQIFFHAVILARAQQQIEENSQRLPEISVLLELNRSAKMWFPVLGMTGGFHYWFESEGFETRLVSESWCRVVGGSGERHEITHSGVQLVDSGFC